MNCENKKLFMTMGTFLLTRTLKKCSCRDTTMEVACYIAFIIPKLNHDFPFYVRIMEVIATCSSIQLKVAAAKTLGWLFFSPLVGQ